MRRNFQQEGERSSAVETTRVEPERPAVRAEALEKLVATEIVQLPQASGYEGERFPVVVVAVALDREAVGARMGLVKNDAVIELGRQLLQNRAGRGVTVDDFPKPGRASPRDVVVPMVIGPHTGARGSEDAPPQYSKTESNQDVERVALDCLDVRIIDGVAISSALRLDGQERNIREQLGRAPGSERVGVRSEQLAIESTIDGVNQPVSV